MQIEEPTCADVSTWRLWEYSDTNLTPRVRPRTLRYEPSLGDGDGSISRSFTTDASLLVDLGESLRQSTRIVAWTSTVPTSCVAACKQSSIQRTWIVAEPATVDTSFGEACRESSRQRAVAECAVVLASLRAAIRESSRLAESSMTVTSSVAKIDTVLESAAIGQEIFRAGEVLEDAEGSGEVVHEIQQRVGTVVDDAIADLALTANYDSTASWRAPAAACGDVLLEPQCSPAV